MASLMDMARIAAAAAQAPAALRAPRARLGKWGKRMRRTARMHQLRRHLKHKADSLRRQAVANNAGGRSRTIDHLLPVAEDGRRAKPSGKGGWKKWTPEALLRAAFASENAALRQVAQEVDGASAAHARRARLFVAQLIEQTQREGMDRECRQMAHAATEAGQGPLFHILNKLDVALHGLGPGTWSILASHAQISVRAADQTRDYDIVRPPQALPNKTAPCMFGALCQNLGGLWPTLQGTLIVLPQEPPGLQAEWLAGRQHAAQFLELAFGAVTENKRRARRAQEFLAFFAGPWSGLTCGGCVHANGRGWLGGACSGTQLAVQLTWKRGNLMENLLLH
ncbi:unnamed protein product [Effrenium voratum]|uniref:Uncharacterized protein n=1 Tax=Effrenium voratum TaxID=2562239 RepID=A0AA36IHZ2_9DINO|nr:unnamed protein product [Effrenium voratum]